MPELPSATSEELEAIRQAWAEDPSYNGDLDPPPEEAQRILADIGKRQAEAEAYALYQLRRATRQPYSMSGFRSPYLLVFFLWVLVPLVALLALVDLLWRR